MFNFDQFNHIVRSIILIVGSIAVTKGYIDNSTLAEVPGALATLGAVIWGMWFHAGADKADLIKVVKHEAPPSVQQKVAKAVNA